MFWRKWIATNAPSAVFLVRLLAGGIFLSEGIQKFLFPSQLGAGRFAKIGIPVPHIMGPFVGSVEIVCGTLLLLGLLTRFAAIPLLINICVAILSTKIPVLIGHGFWGFSLPKLSTYGFWSMLHEARADFSMLLGLLFLLIVGAGTWSFDDRIAPQERIAETPL
jgi:putative oxidoreductase